MGGAPGAPGWVHTPGGSYRVGGAPAAPHAPAAPAAGLGPIPPGLYSPTRDVELVGGKAQYQQQRSKAERESGYAEDDFGINQAKLGYQKGTGLEDIGTERTRQNEAAQKTLAQLAESYKKLGVSQEGQANKAGVLQGGALLQAAAKRAANEGKGRAETNLTLQHQLEDDTLRENRLKHSIEEGEGSNTRNSQRLLGGFGEDITNSNLNEHNFEEGIETTKGLEAVNEHAYDPTLLHNPLLKGLAAKSKGGAGWVHTKRGSYRIGGRR